MLGFDHVTPILFELHWLPIVYRIKFKIILLTFKALHGQSPMYVNDLITVNNGSRYSLRSSNNGAILEYPKRRLLTTLGARAFSNAAQTLWNSLPKHLREEHSPMVFKRKLKTFLFTEAFCP